MSLLGGHFITDNTKSEDGITWEFFYLSMDRGSLAFKFFRSIFIEKKAGPSTFDSQRDI